ncbi:protein GVQW3-like [Sitodiplosis mosellana]|uniref:protein GVQW3-like n=1 Tax=Sitodiplosis mosellana TaxID=263140 RepID=UPI002443B281|nr:protein GVQW3-like [Sitodiplosis mosellana]
MSEIIQQRSAIKFCFLNGISAAETLRMLQKAYGDQAPSKTTTFDWYKMFKEGRQRVEDEERPGRPSTSTDGQHVNKIKELVLENCRLTIRDLADDIGISKGSVNTILKDVLGLKRVKSRLVPKTLNFLCQKREFFAKNSTHIVPQPPYSPDLAPCDFWLFSKLKRPLRGHCFDTIDQIKAESKKVLKAIPANDFLGCFEDWKKRWHKCIASGGDYFEGDEIDLEE